MDHVSRIFVKRLYDLGINPGSLDIDLEKNIVNEIRNSVTRGIILFNHQSDDSHNPLDRQLEIYSYVNLSSIDPSLSGIAKLKIICRMSLTDGSISLRTIQKNFSIE
jgi:hypothetical protein